MLNTIYTIGHSSHSRERFFSLLQACGITAICDVRSNPYSRYSPQFNREELEQSAQSCGMMYRFFGRELGARSEDFTCYEGGRVRYDRLSETILFRQGLKRVLSGVRQGFQIALMCAEKEPLECHRTILVSRHLASTGVHIRHIHSDGRLETHEAALGRLIQLHSLPDVDFFHSRDEIVAEAYRLQEECIAYELVRGAAVAAGIDGAGA
jgi:uncharacterized protein (DUF488 family)